MTTAILPQTLELGLSQANPGFLADALRRVNLGSFFKLQKETITQSAADTVDIAKAAIGPAMFQERVTAVAASACPVGHTATTARARAARSRASLAVTAAPAPPGAFRPAPSPAPAAPPKATVAVGAGVGFGKVASMLAATAPAFSDRL
jgi:hypothetical protein